jgi:hypothetical protein
MQVCKLLARIAFPHFLQMARDVITEARNLGAIRAVSVMG